MKDRSEFRARLGLSQHEMATLLGVGRSLYSLYELGRRVLPTSALVQLAELEQLQTTSGKVAPVKHNHDQLLAKMLKENEYKLLVLARKISIATKKQDSGVRLSGLVDSLNTTKKNEAKLQTVTRKIVKASAHSEMLFKLELKHELLLLEKSLLESKLRGV